MISSEQTFDYQWYRPRSNQRKQILYKCSAFEANFCISFFMKRPKIGKLVMYKTIDILGVTLYNGPYIKKTTRDNQGQLHQW